MQIDPRISGSPPTAASAAQAETMRPVGQSPSQASETQAREETPLLSFPELIALVREAVSQSQQSDPRLDEIRQRLEQGQYDRPEVAQQTAQTILQGTGPA